MFREVSLPLSPAFFASAAGAASAAGPDYTLGEPNSGGPRFDCEGGQCQYGYHDDMPGNPAVTLGMGQQLGIGVRPGAHFRRRLLGRVLHHARSGERLCQR